MQLTRTGTVRSVSFGLGEWLTSKPDGCLHPSEWWFPVRVHVQYASKEVSILSKLIALETVLLTKKMVERQSDNTRGHVSGDRFFLGVTIYTHTFLINLVVHVTVDW